jgi:CheY-like chemotaxis protein
MTQTSQEQDASDLPKEKSASQTITKSINIIPVDQIIPNLTYASLMTMLKLLKNHIGTVNIESPHFSWKIFIHCGSIAFIEDESDFLSTLKRKLQIQKNNFPQHILLSSTSKPLDSIETCKLLGKLYAQDRENYLTIFKEILLENLLAISLEKTFSMLWKPLVLDNPIILPIWQINELEKAIAKATKQWRTFTHVRHPYQMVQLLDPECEIAQVSLFNQVTNGKCRISEIADSLQQHITRTALKLDKLAENCTVAILPLTLRSSDINNEDLVIEKAREVRSQQPKVMIVDDSPLLLKQFGNLLANWGYQLCLVNDSANATRQILSEKPDIVFMDINMPNLNGFDLTKQIRREPSLASIPLVLITSENTITNNFRAKWANCRFLGKPLKSDDIQEFQEQVRTILQDFASKSQL